MRRTEMLLICLVGASSVWAGDLARPPVFFAISVPSLDASVKWYTEILGLTATMLPPTLQAKVALVGGAGLLVELIQPSEPSSTDARAPSPRQRYLERGFVKVGFYVEDLDATVARLKEKGARFMGSVYSDQTVGARSILVLDNDENLIQLFDPFTSINITGCRTTIRCSFWRPRARWSAAARDDSKAGPRSWSRYSTVHPTKTQLLPFRPRGSGQEPKDGTRRRGFDSLGFTHYWERSRRGLWVVKQKTASDRFGRALRAVSEWLKAHRHHAVAWQHRQLERKLRAHDAYYGVTGNSLALGRLRREVTRRWRHWLSRRSSKARLNWTRFKRLLECYPLPDPVIFHRFGPRAANP